MNYYLLFATLLIFGQLNGQSSYFVPGNLFIVGYDNEIDSNGSDLIVLHNIIPIDPGDHFLITDMTYQNETHPLWISEGGSPSYARIEYTGDDRIEANSNLSLYLNISANQMDQIQIKMQEMDISSSFNTDIFGDFTGLSTQGSSNLYLYQGEWNAYEEDWILNGHYIAGLVLEGQAELDIPEDASNTTIKLPQGDESGWGVLLCDSIPYLCTFGDIAVDPFMWNYTTGDNKNNIEGEGGTGGVEPCDPILVFPECTSVKIEEVSCESDCHDVIFLLDNSGSISRGGDPSEMDQVLGTLAQTVHGLDDQVADLRYAVAQFANSGDYDLTLGFTDDASLVDQLTFAYPPGLGTDVRCAVNNVLADISGGILSTREECINSFVLLTDAVQGTPVIGETDYFEEHCLSYSTNDLFDVYNSVKQALDVTVVWFSGGQQDQLSEEICAAIASQGGGYSGSVFDNPYDPDYQLLPRQFYSTDFAQGVPGLADSLNDCGILSIEIDRYCINGYPIWQALDGGFISGESEGVTEVRTNGVGTYTVEVFCDNQCVLRDTLITEPEESAEKQSTPDPGKNTSPFLYVNGHFLTLFEYHQFLEDPEFTLSKVSWEDPISIYPNPTTTEAYILLPEEFERIEEISIRTSRGQRIKSLIPQYANANQIKVNTEDLTVGLYFITLRTDKNQYQKTLMISK